MVLRFYNTMSRRSEPFAPAEAGVVRMYTCGPTVYDYAHIGNFRTYVFEDLLRRWLLSKGWRVVQVMNLTDVDDKTIQGANAQGVTLEEFTRPYKQAFFEDIAALRVQPAEHYPEATAHVAEMIELIKKLEAKGHTYVSAGSVYFRISTFADYGKLSGMDLAGLQPGARVESDEYVKEEARDFALWKGAREGEPSWDSPWGPGRPGWHVECSAMSMKYLGESFDIHTGGVDNIFPHHENEIAQSEGATGASFVRVWLHAAHLVVDGQKMSKSLGNFYTLRDLTAKGYDAVAIRYFLLATHYRRAFNMTFEGLAASSEAVTRLQDFRRRVDTYVGDGGDHMAAPLAAATRGFTDALDNDLNIAEGLAALFDVVTAANRAMDGKSLSAKGRAALSALLDGCDAVLDVMTPTAFVLDADVERLIADREEARRAKDFARADAIRDRLKGAGITLEDGPDGVRWKRKAP